MTASAATTTARRAAPATRSGRLSPRGRSGTNPGARVGAGWSGNGMLAKLEFVGGRAFFGRAMKSYPGVVVEDESWNEDVSVNEIRAVMLRESSLLRRRLRQRPDDQSDGLACPD